MFNPNRPQTFAVTPKYITTRFGYTGDKLRFLPLEAAKRRLGLEKRPLFQRTPAKNITLDKISVFVPPDSIR